MTFSTMTTKNMTLVMGIIATLSITHHMALSIMTQSNKIGHNDTQHNDTDDTFSNTTIFFVT